MSSNKFSKIAYDLLKSRYLKENETPQEMFRRTARWIARAETKDRDIWSEKFYNLMNNLDFLPNSPCLMNAGTSMPQLAACFVYPVYDDMESIFNTLKHAAVTHKSGGGTGFSFSRLRPRGDIVHSTRGTTSGPVSFIEVYDKATEAIRQGGKRRGANMGILRVDHPDIEDFINAKQKENKLNNFNISVALTDEFMDAFANGEEYNLYFPKGTFRGRKPAKKILDMIAKGAWENGEPGVIFIDKINRKNPLIKLGEIEATNPCAEQPLLPYEACILGSINLSNFVKAERIDWERLEKAVKTSVRFLDDAIDMSAYPLQKIKEVVKSNRKIGLGVMGFASALMKLEIPYASSRGIKTGRKIMKFVQEKSHEASKELFREKGAFPNFKKSGLKEKRRNALVTTIAPTGSISLIAGTSSGIEPLYSLAAQRRTDEGNKYTIIDSVFLKKIQELGFDGEKIIKEVIEKGGVKHIVSLPEDKKQIFLTAVEIEPRIHVMMQAAFQRYVDNAISKTVNLPEDFTLNNVKDIILKAYRLGCKGITLYRQHSRTRQVFDIACPCEESYLKKCDVGEV